MRPEYGCPRGEPLHHELTAGTVTSVPRSSEPPPSLPPPMHTHWGPAGRCWGTPQSVVGTQPSPPLGPRWQTVPSGGDSGAQQRRRWPEPPSQSAQDVWFMRSVSAWFRTSLLLANRTERWWGGLCARGTRVYIGDRQQSSCTMPRFGAHLWGIQLKSRSRRDCRRGVGVLASGPCCHRSEPRMSPAVLSLPATSWESVLGK